MKKLVALLLTVVLALSFSLSALAVPSNVSYPTTRAALKALDQKGIVYDYKGINEDNGNEKVRLEYELDNLDVYFDIFFDEDLTSAHLRLWDYVVYNPTDFLSVVQACNSSNLAYKWTSFYTESDNTVTIKMDVMLDSSNAGDLIPRCIDLLCAIADDAYGSFAAYDK